MDNNSEIMLQRLLTACETWNLDEVRYVVETGFNVDTADDDRVTALQIAAANGNIGIVEYLLDMGANIEKDNQVGMTPLLHAAKNGHCNVIRVLLQRGAAIDKLTYYGASAITLAASGGHTNVVHFLINLKLSVNPQEERDTALGPTPMMAAVFKRHTHICVLLAQHGANLDNTIARLDNLSAMSIAITCDARVMVATLLELKSNPMIRSLGNRKPIELAHHLKRDEIYALIENAHYLTKERTLQERDLRSLILNRDEANLRRALRRQLTQTYPESCTLLMYAVVLADIFIVKLVVEETNEINAAEEIVGLTALMFAAIIGNNEMVEYLLMNGADISQVSKDQLNALDYAFCLGTLDAHTLCVMQQYLISGSSAVSATKSDNHFSGSRSGMAKLFQKIGFGNSGTNGESKEKLLQSKKEHIEKLLNLCGNRSCVGFKTANDVLLSAVCSKNCDIPDVYHRRLRKIRSLAEQCIMFGLSPLPIWFTAGDVSSSRNDHSPTETTAVTSLRKHSSEFLKEHPCFSIAQKNNLLFNEICYDKSDDQKLRCNESRLRRVFEQNDRRKASTATSISGSEGRSFRRASRSYSMVQHTFGNVLGTAHNIRYSREKIAADSTEDGRTSPSRRSLDQYTFTLKDKSTALRKSTSTSALDGERNKNCNSFPPLNSFPISTPISVAAQPSNTNRQLNLFESLENAGLGQYIELFKQNEIDKDALLLMTELDLEVLISDATDRKKLKKFVEKLRR